MKKERILKFLKYILDENMESMIRRVYEEQSKQDHQRVMVDPMLLIV